VYFITLRFLVRKIVTFYINDVLLFNTYIFLRPSLFLAAAFRFHICSKSTATFQTPSFHLTLVLSTGFLPPKLPPIERQFVLPQTRNAVDENWVLLDYSAATSGNSYRRFGAETSVGITTARCVITPKRAVLEVSLLLE